MVFPHETPRPERASIRASAYSESFGTSSAEIFNIAQESGAREETTDANPSVKIVT